MNLGVGKFHCQYESLQTRLQTDDLGLNLSALRGTFFCDGAQNKSGRTAVYSDRFAMHRL